MRGQPGEFKILWEERVWGTPSTLWNDLLHASLGTKTCSAFKAGSFPTFWEREDGAGALVGEGFQGFFCPPTYEIPCDLYVKSVDTTVLLK